MNDKILGRLGEAARSGALVRLRRSIPGAERIEGFVVGVGAEWTLMAVCTDIHLDGWAAVRTADITKVRVRGDETCLTVRALRHRGQWPVQDPGPAAVLEGGLPALADAASRGFGLVSLYEEQRVPDACWIGEVTELRPKSLRVREIDTDARWRSAPTTFRFEDVTRIGFGGRYERTLREFAVPHHSAGKLR